MSEKYLGPRHKNFINSDLIRIAYDTEIAVESTKDVLKAMGRSNAHTDLETERASLQEKSTLPQAST